MVFRSSSQNRKTVKSEQDSRSHTKSNKTFLISIFFFLEKVGKRSKKCQKNKFPKLESESKISQN